MVKLYKRELYLSRLRPFYNSDLIKVITGIRRCGKSSLLLTIQDELRATGVDDAHIIDINLDKRGFKSIKLSSQLEEVIEAHAKVEGLKYLFIDEVQNVKGFEDVVNAYREEGDWSIFLTGSNSYLLSGELVTKLTGRHVEFEMFPLNYHEYLDMGRWLGVTNEKSDRSRFDDFLRFGGFPKNLEFQDVEARRLYVESVITQIMEKDVRAWQKVGNWDRFDRVASYLINNFGATTSIPSITKAMSATLATPITQETVSRYARLLQNAKLLNKCQRFDMKSRRSIGAQEKYYLSDTSIYFVRNTDNRINYGPVLENVLYTYLKSKGYSVSVGRIGNLECDFIVRKRDDYAYVQVAMSIADPRTEEREYAVFGRIRDGYPRYLLTLDPLLQKRDGVRHLNLMDFMADNGELL